MTVRTRIAPSPTGYMHVGTLRTALFDYFLARQNKGEFLIRIEDTDQERLVPGALESLLTTFKKLGLDYDEGPMLQADGSVAETGPYGPYTQSKRLDLYRTYADGLVTNGHAYSCFCTKERLEEMRAVQTANKQTPKYDRACLQLSKEEVKRRKGAGEHSVIRMKIPEGSSTFVDGIRGEIHFDNADVDDQVLIKSDGFPTYHLAVVVDDHLMKITHVLRGEEWISSTPKQIILHQMLGWAMPVYAHVPLILNPDKTKLSKRKGDVSVEGFLSKGYLPEALLNFISTLGFNPKSDQEIYTRDELVELFDLSKVHSSGAVMNMEKLDWMNGVYLRKKTAQELVELCKPFLDQAGISVPTDLLERILEVEKGRMTRLIDCVELLPAYLAQPSYDPQLLVWKKADVADARKNLIAVQQVLESHSPEQWTIPLIEQAIKGYSESEGIPNGNVLWPLRVALSGRSQSAGPFELAWVLGKSETLRRLSFAIESLA